MHESQVMGTSTFVPILLEPSVIQQLSVNGGEHCSLSEVVAGSVLSSSDDTLIILT